jgi:glutamate/tyrosine decarboxylase-like PLP-dependent enzyme
MAKLDAAFRQALETAQQEAVAYLEGLDSASVATTTELRTLRNRLRKPLADQGLDADQVVAELARDVEGGLLGSPGGRFFAWVIGGSLPAALAADWLASTWDQNAGLHACAPAAGVVEEVAGEWLKDILGLPADASFALVTGCQMAHATCLAAARHAVLENQGWNVQQKGLFGAPRVRLLTSDQQHTSLNRSVRLLGLGLDSLIALPQAEPDRFPVEALERELKKDPSAPTIVAIQAGDVNTGAFDSFEEIIPLAKKYGAWVHVDGAFGLWIAASPRYRHLLKGAEQADSWATDGHKWLNVPYDCGYAFVADSKAHQASMSHRASYLVHNADARDEMDWNPEFSRRARGFPTYAALRQLGREGVRDLVERNCRHAHELVMQIGALPGAEVVSEPIINQGLVRFLDPRPGATDQDHDRHTDEVIGAIVRTGEAFFGGTTWQGRRAMRVSVSNWQTSEQDVARVVSAVAEVLKVHPVASAI